LKAERLLLVRRTCKGISKAVSQASRGIYDGGADEQGHKNYPERHFCIRAGGLTDRGANNTCQNAEHKIHKKYKRMEKCMPVFIGIDLAWQSNKNHSGGTVLHGDQSGVEIQTVSSGLTTQSDVETFIRRHALGDSVIAIDAPLIITNAYGQRACETEIGRRFGAAHASAHSSNQTLYPNAVSVLLAKTLEGHGFQHCPQPHKRHLSGKWFFEVYPHPAHVVLFRRSRIIKYKKGRVTSRKNGVKSLS